MNELNLFRVNLFFYPRYIARIGQAIYNENFFKVFGLSKLSDKLRTNKASAAH